MGHGYSAKGLLLLVLVVSCMLQVVQSTFCTKPGKLVKSYYHASCPKAEQIVRKVVAKAAIDDPRGPASLVRLFFHDCFVSVRIQFPSQIHLHFNIDIIVLHHCMLGSIALNFAASTGM
jgi:hypothetical protein